MKKSLYAVILSVMIAGVVNAGNSVPLKLGIADYGAPHDSITRQWIDQRFTIRVSGQPPVASGVKRFNYWDIHGIYISDYLSLKNWALSRGIKYEEIFIHSKVNYIYDRGSAWFHLDAFGVFEGNTGEPKNGVIKQTATAYQDLSAQAYFGPQPVTLDNTVYFGYEEPFMEVRFTFLTVGAGVNAVYEYYDGTGWASLIVADSTLNFTENGSLFFTPPANWDTVRVNASIAKYFIRCMFSSATTFPVTSKICGDNWIIATIAGKDSCRGWDGSAPGVNISNPRFAFNCNPPAGARAKFPYQARVSFWADNHFICNPADKQVFNGINQYTWAAFAAQDIIVCANSDGGFDGTMCDDASCGIGVVADSLTDFADKANNSGWDDYIIIRFRSIYDKIKSIQPELLVGLNSYDPRLVFFGDWNVTEMHTFVWQTNGWAGIGEGTANAPWSTTYDDYLPAVNQRGVFALQMYYDPFDTLPNGYVWDRANRGPLTALSKHYIGMNENTWFFYHSRLGYRYDETDELYMKDGTVIHRAATPLPDNLDLNQITRWATWFPAMAVDIGAPVGKRNVSWQKAADIDQVLSGGSPHGDIWRRDFTNAVILHRPGEWNSTSQDYSTFSKSIPLDGAYYPLCADGKIGKAVTEIALRMNDGAVLMKNPVNGIMHQGHWGAAGTAIVNNFQLNRHEKRVTIELTLSDKTHFSAYLYDARGRTIARIIDNVVLRAGHQVLVQTLQNPAGQKISAGAYFIVLRLGNDKITNKIFIDQ